MTSFKLDLMVPETKVYVIINAFILLNVWYVLYVCVIIIYQTYAQF